MKSYELLASYDRDTSSWRMLQHSLLETAAGGLDTFSDSLPKSGLMRNGMLYRLGTLMDYQPERRTVGSESGLWPTPQANKRDASPRWMKTRKDGLSMEPNLAGMAKLWPTPTSTDAVKRGNVSPRPGAMGLTETMMNPEYWPTPAATDHKGAGKNGTPRDRLDYAAERGATKSKTYEVPKTEGQLNPAWVCWLMGLPLDYLDLDGYQNPELEGLPPEYLTEPTNSKRLETA